MKIISKQKDFYDYYAKDPRISDQSFRWDRKAERVRTGFASPTIFTNHMMSLGAFKNHRDISIIGFNIFFCGEIIPVLCVKKDMYDSNEIDYFYDIDSLPEYIKDYKKTYCSIWNKIIILFGVVNNPWCHKLSNGMVLIRKSIIDMHRYLKAPVFINSCVLMDCRWGDSGITEENSPLQLMYATHGMGDQCYFTTNIILSKFNFIKKMDAFTTFQNLERFLSNDLSTYQDKSDQVKISDKLKAETHGFDKFSFRKDKAIK